MLSNFRLLAINLAAALSTQFTLQLPQVDAVRSKQNAIAIVGSVDDQH